MLPQEISEIRGKTDDSAIFTQLLQSDPEFKAKVERVQTANPNMTPFEKMKFPSAMIDIHLGKRPRTNSKLDQTTSMLNQNMREDDQPSALGTLVKDPLVFAGQTLANVPRSAMNLVGGVAQAVAHPLQTGKNLVQLGVGGVANTLESIADLAGVKNAEQIFDLGSEEVASAVGDFYAQRYGGIENAAKTLRDDPVGFLSDLGAVVSGVGGVIKGGASLAQAGARVATTGMSPVSLTSTAAKVGRVASQAQNVGSTLVKTGINMEPLVIAGKGTVYAGGKIRSAVQDAFGAERQMSTALKLHPTMNEKFARSTMSGGETPAMYAIRKGVSGGSRAEIAEKFQNIADVSRRHVDDTLARFRQTYDVADEVPRVRDVLQKILDKYEASPTGNEAVISHVKALMRRERMSLTDINGVKRMIDDAFDLYKREPTEVERAAIEGMENMRWELQSFIEDQAKLKGFDDIGIFNKDTQLSTFMAKAIERADMSKYGNNILSLTDSIIASALAGGGLAVGSGGLGFFTAAGVLLTRKILGSVRFKTTFAKYISRITPGQRRALEIASKTGRHTKESRLILRRVVAQTAEDIKNNRIGEMEAASAPPIETIQSSPKSQASQVDDMARLTPEEKATGLIGGSDYVDNSAKVGQSAKTTKDNGGSVGGVDTSRFDNIPIEQLPANDVPQEYYIHRVAEHAYNNDRTVKEVILNGKDYTKKSADILAAKEGATVKTSPYSKDKYVVVKTKAGDADGLTFEEYLSKYRADFEALYSTNTSQKALPRNGATMGITKDIEPLLAEARKYKSAEEFVRGVAKVGEGNLAKDFSVLKSNDRVMATEDLVNIWNKAHSK